WRRAVSGPSGLLEKGGDFCRRLLYEFPGGVPHHSG
ncbi:HTH lysR-type domain-containing protein, partial [Dysosmobacter welbionis]